MEEVLISTFMEEYDGGLEEFKKSRFKNSVILFSKSLFALSDLIIFKKLSIVPKNHAERFKILKEYASDIYLTADYVFDKYTDSYTKPVLKDTCELMKNAIKKIAKSKEVPERIREHIEKA